MVTLKGSSTRWPESAVLAVHEWLEDLLVHDVTALATVIDLACNDRPPPKPIEDKYIASGLLPLQTTRRDLTRLMILDPDDPMSMRLARWDELEVTPVG